MAGSITGSVLVILLGVGLGGLIGWLIGAARARVDRARGRGDSRPARRGG